jgi:uncharacterized SAM-binding protein YcdF (DUF218 family)
MTQAVPPAPLPVLIVLGARLNPRGEPGRVARLRLQHALQLWWEHHPNCRLLLTGGQLPGTAVSEARAMADWSQLWVEEKWGPEVREQFEVCLLLEEASRSTAASARQTLPLVQQLGCRSVGLVTDAVHIHRALFLFRRRFRPQGIAVHPLPARGLVRHYWRQRRYLWLTKMVLREGGAWVKVFAGQALRFLKP